MMLLGDVIKAKRLENGLTQAELADGYSSGWVASHTFSSIKVICKSRVWMGRANKKLQTDLLFKESEKTVATLFKS